MLYVKYHMFVISENEPMFEFQSSLKKAALVLILEILGNMNFARSAGFEMLDLFQEFLSKLVEGLKLFIGPIVGNENEDILEDIIAAIELSFSDISTEHRFHTRLVKNDLLCSLKKYVMLMEENEEEVE